LSENAYIQNLQEKAFGNIKNIKRWKKVNRVPKSSKVFICCGGYPSLVTDLQNRGWVRNRCLNSPCWDLKWVMNKKDVDL